MHKYLAVSCSCFLVAALSLAKPVGTEKTSETARTPVEGVWEQVGLRTKDGKLEESNRTQFDFLKWVMIVKDKKCFVVRSVVLGLKVESYRLTLNSDSVKNAIDLDNPDDNRRIRCLFELKDDNLTLCWHGAGKTLRRPEKIEATQDGFDVNIFKRLQAPPSKKDKAKPGEIKLAGIWETVSYEVDGGKLETDDKERFLKSQKVFFFDGTTYTLVGTNDSALVVFRRDYGVGAGGDKRAIDFDREDGQNVPAIYELKDDRLTICWNWNGTSRPDQFRTQQDDGLALITLKRIDK